MMRNTQKKPYIAKLAAIVVLCKVWELPHRPQRRRCVSDREWRLCKPCAQSRRHSRVIIRQRSQRALHSTPLAGATGPSALGQVDGNDDDEFEDVVAPAGDESDDEDFWEPPYVAGGEPARKISRLE